MADVDDVWESWRDAVNMTATELEEWLGTEESRSVGVKDPGRESTGHRSGRRIATVLRTRRVDLTEDDVEHMRTVIGYVHQHTAQRPDGDVLNTPWRYSLMN